MVSSDCELKRLEIRDFVKVQLRGRSMSMQSCAGTRNRGLGNFLAVHWLRLCASIAGGLGSFPGQGTRIPQAMCCMAKKIKQKATNQPLKNREPACKPWFANHCSRRI